MQQTLSPPRRRRTRSVRRMAKRMFLTEEGGMSIVTVSLFTTWMTLLLMDVKLLGLVHLLLLAALFLLFRNGGRVRRVTGREVPEITAR